MHGKEIAEMVMMGAAVMGETCRKKKQVAKERKGDKACHGKGYGIACMDKVRSAASGGFGLPLWFLLGLLWTLEIGLK